MRVVLDPGVLIAAVIAPRGTSGRLLADGLAGRFELVISPTLLGELQGVLVRARFRRYMTATEVGQLIAQICHLIKLHDDPPPLPGVTPDPKDDYLVALARAADVDYLVSGDRHLTELSDPDPPVLTPRAFLELLH